MKGNECNFREAVTLALATGMMYGGAVFVLIFDNPVIGFTAAALNFLFWVWIAGFFVFFGKDTVFRCFSVKNRAIMAAFFWLNFCSKRFKTWAKDQLRNCSCTSEVDMEKAMLEHWAKVEEQLRLALAELPSEETAQVKEYLDHNELGLAWEDMKEIADAQGIVTAEFWRPMAKAAGLMNLCEGNAS